MLKTAAVGPAIYEKNLGNKNSTFNAAWQRHEVVKVGLLTPFMPMCMWAGIITASPRSTGTDIVLGDWNGKTSHRSVRKMIRDQRDLLPRRG